MPVMTEPKPSQPPVLSAERRALLDEFDAGRRTALARVISVIENEREGHEAVLHTLHHRLGHAHRMGLTGPPGAGKSTLSAALIEHLRERDESVGVVAVDPTSPFTGGALLGDRIRMNDIAQDDGVFIRSMATRGSLGGLAVTTKEVADILDAFGFDRVLLETVGVGQSELDIAATADTTIVVLVPESGDSIQTMKAGLMEAADLFVVNKADRPGADRLAHEVELMLHLRAGQALRGRAGHHGAAALATADRRPPTDAVPGRRRPPDDNASAGEAEEVAGKPASRAERAAQGGIEGQRSAVVGQAQGGADWTIPVLRTTAQTGQGVGELLAAIDRHRAWLEASGELALRRQRRLAERVRDVVRRSLMAIAWSDGHGARILDEAMADLQSGNTTPYAVAARIVRAVTG
jgi:LAO/AO transport system kinase